MRVAVVDDHQIMRDRLVSLIDALDGIAVVGTGATGNDAIRLASEQEPDVLLMDMRMPELDGIDATQLITDRHPNVRIVMLTMNEDDATVLSAIRAGASGYLLKGADATEVDQALRAAATGGMVFGAALAHRIGKFFAGTNVPEQVTAQPFPELTDRERAVLRLIAIGRTNDQIAGEVHVSGKTVRNVVSSIYAKIHADRRAEAIDLARDAGLV